MSGCAQRGSWKSWLSMVLRGAPSPTLQHTMGIPQKVDEGKRQGEYRETTNVHEMMNVSIAPLS